MARVPELAFNLYRHNRVQPIREIRYYFRRTGDVERLLAQLPDVMRVVRQSGDRLYNSLPLAFAYLDLFSPWCHDERYQAYRRDLYGWLTERTHVRFRIGGRAGAHVKPLRLP